MWRGDARSRCSFSRSHQGCSAYRPARDVARVRQRVRRSSCAGGLPVVAEAGTWFAVRRAVTAACAEPPFISAYRPRSPPPSAALARDGIPPPRRRPRASRRNSTNGLDLGRRRRWAPGREHRVRHQRLDAESHILVASGAIAASSRPLRDITRPRRVRAARRGHGRASAGRSSSDTGGSTRTFAGSLTTW
jgi:hypothetical protein